MTPRIVAAARASGAVDNDAAGAGGTGGAVDQHTPVAAAGAMPARPVDPEVTGSGSPDRGAGLDLDTAEVSARAGSSAGDGQTPSVLLTRVPLPPM